MNEFTDLYNLSVYPNPTHDFVSIDTRGIEDKVKVTLLNNMGQVILTKELKVNDLNSIEIEGASGPIF